ncbi:MAG: putative quinol monooxygenase [Nakamurella sp.]
MTVIVVATITPKPEHRDEIIALFEATIARVHQEDGCELYAMHEDNDTIVMIEKWRSAEDLEAHSGGAAISEMNPQVEGKTAAKTEIKVYTPHPAGDAAKGQL